MALVDAIWNESSRLINEEFVRTGQPLTGTLLRQILENISELLTEPNPE